MATDSSYQISGSRAYPIEVTSDTIASSYPNKLGGDLAAHRKSEFLRHIPKTRWDKIIQEIEEIGRRVTEDELNDFVEGKWKRPIFQDPNWIYFAFQAYLEDRLDQETICKLLLYDTALKEALEDTPVQTYQVFPSPQTSSKKTCSKRSVQVLNRAVTSYLDKDAFNRLGKALSRLPPHQTQFFAVKRMFDTALTTMAHPESNIKFDLMTIQGEKNQCSEGMVWQVIAPPKFMDEIHKARFGAKAMRSNPCLGPAKFPKLSNPDTRIVSIPSSLVPLPPSLHLLEATPLTFYHHDIVYHFAIESANSHRSVWIDFALFVKSQEVPQWMFPVILDRELLNYLKERKPIDMDNFWIGVAYLADVIKMTNIKEQGNNYPDNQKIFIELFVNFIYENQDILDNQYGISIESLQSCLLSRIKDPMLFPNDFKFLQDLYLALTDLPMAST